MNGKPLVLGGPTAAVGVGGGASFPRIAKRQGLALIRSVQDNLLVAGLGRVFPKAGIVRLGHRASPRQLIGRLHVSTPSPRRLAKFLSGGNQQKVVIGKVAQCRVPVLHFRRADSRRRRRRKSGNLQLHGRISSPKAPRVLMISSELPEMVAVCDRAYVMRDKTIVAELGASGPDARKHSAACHAPFVNVPVIAWRPFTREVR